MSISLDEVRHVARLSRLELDEGELVVFQGELNALLGQFNDLTTMTARLHVDRPHHEDRTNVWANDTVVQGLSQEEALKNAAVTRAGLFIVPTIIEE